MNISGDERADEEGSRAHHAYVYICRAGMEEF